MVSGCHIIANYFLQDEHYQTPQNDLLQATSLNTSDQTF